MAYLCTTILLQHLASDAWFILNNAAYASPDTIMRACTRVSAFVWMCVRTPACVCVFATTWEADSRASHLSAQQGCYGNDRERANKSNEDALNCCELTLKKPDLRVRCTRCSVADACRHLKEGWRYCSEASVPQCTSMWSVFSCLSTHPLFFFKLEIL